MCATHSQAAEPSNAIAYHCNMSGRAKEGPWVSPQIMFVLKRSGQVSVFDAVILDLSDDPIEAVVKRKKDVLTLKWTVTIPRERFVYGLNHQFEEPKVNYKALLNVKKNSLVVIAKPPREDWRGTGTCTVLKM